MDTIASVNQCLPFRDDKNFYGYYNLCQSMSFRASISDDEEPLQGKKRKMKSSMAPKKIKKRRISDEVDPLDQTWIHPESYDSAQK
jgi:hypothetical protein